MQATTRWGSVTEPLALRKSHLRYERLEVPAGMRQC